MSTSKSKRENKSMKALFSVVCLCIIALGMIVYFYTNSNHPDTVNQPTTLVQTTAVQKAVTVTETTAKTTAAKTTTAKAKAKTKTKAEPTTMEQGEGNTPYQSFYEYPLGEAVLSGYSEELVYDKTMQDYRAHAAVDFKGEIGDKVQAINEGIVLRAYTDNLLGSVVEIDHGGKLVARYCGLKSVSVKEGSRVKRGGAVGTLGKVPAEGSEEPHLHFETLLDGRAVNPLDVMGKTE